VELPVSGAKAKL
jgi:small GTP-binding protein